MLPGDKETGLRKKKITRKKDFYNQYGRLGRKEREDEITEERKVNEGRLFRGRIKREGGYRWKTTQISHKKRTAEGKKKRKESGNQKETELRSRKSKAAHH